MNAAGDNEDADVQALRSDEAEVDRLRRFLTRPGPRFGLALALYADPVVARDYRARLIDESDAGVAVVEFHYDDDHSDLVGRIVSAASDDEVDAVFVLGLERLVSDGFGNTRSTSAVANLNQRRDELPAIVDARVVVWLPKSAEHDLDEVAWDLSQVFLSTAEFVALRTRKLEPRRIEAHPVWMDLAEAHETPALERQLTALEAVHAQTTDPHGQADASSSIAELLVRLGRTREAVVWHERSAAAATQADERADAAAQHRRLAQLWMVLGDLEASESHARDAERLVPELGRERALAWLALADVEIRRAAHERAQERLRDQIIPAFAEAGDRGSEAAAWDRVATILELSGDLDEAIHVRETHELPLASTERDRVLVLNKIAATLVGKGKLKYARQLLGERVMPKLDQLEDRRVQAQALQQYADLVAEGGDPREAQRVRSLIGDVDDLRGRTLEMSERAQALASEGRHLDALALWWEVLAIFRQLGDLREQTKTQLSMLDSIVADSGLRGALTQIENEILPAIERIGDVRMQASALERATELRAAIAKDDRRRRRVLASLGVLVFAMLSATSLIAWRFSIQSSLLADELRDKNTELSGLVDQLEHTNAVLERSTKELTETKLELQTRFRAQLASSSERGLAAVESGILAVEASGDPKDAPTWAKASLAQALLAARWMETIELPFAVRESASTDYGLAVFGDDGDDEGQLVYFAGRAQVSFPLSGHEGRVNDVAARLKGPAPACRRQRRADGDASPRRYWPWRHERSAAAGRWHLGLGVVGQGRGALVPEDQRGLDAPELAVVRDPLGDQRPQVLDVAHGHVDHEVVGSRDVVEIADLGQGRDVVPQRVHDLALLPRRADEHQSMTAFMIDDAQAGIMAGFRMALLAAALVAGLLAANSDRATQLAGR